MVKTIKEKILRKCREGEPCIDTINTTLQEVMEALEKFEKKEWVFDNIKGVRVWLELDWNELKKSLEGEE